MRTRMRMKMKMKRKKKREKGERNLMEVKNKVEFTNISTKISREKSEKNTIIATIMRIMILK